jgi:hypothetical protein
VEYVYFIEDGLVSVQAAADELEPIEVWLVGREGVVGSPAVLGMSISPLRSICRRAFAFLICIWIDYREALNAPKNAARHHSQGTRLPAAGLT